jgi:ketosteroid isomerase-like protein
MAAMEAAPDEAVDVEVVRRAVDAWNANDWEEIESFYHPDAVVRAPEGWPESGEFHGWSEVRRQYERLKDAWTKERIDVDEIRALGGGKILLRAHWRGSGASGLEFDVSVDVVYWLRAGRIARTEFFTETGAAAAGGSRGDEQ